MGSGPYIGQPVSHLDWAIRPFAPEWIKRPGSCEPLGLVARRNGRMSLAVFETIGPLELLIVLGIVLLIFGPKRLPGLGRQLGASMREFKDSISRKSDGDDDDSDDTRRQATAALGRPEEEPATKPVSDGVASEQR